MKKELNAHDFEAMYEKLGINLDKLGCVMLETNTIDMPEIFKYEIPEAFYTAKNPDHFWIDGYVADKTPHVTLLYGLLTPAYEQEENIETVLEGWKIETVTIKDFGFFDSPMKDEEYFCIVAHIEVTPVLQEGHDRLEFLPHINTFMGYKPHITIAYIKKDVEVRDRIINDLNKLFAGLELGTGDLDLGSNSK